MANLTPRLDLTDGNYIINGAFDYWQRATSATISKTTSDGWAQQAYVADRTCSNVYRNGFDLSVTTSQQTDVPNSSLQYSLKVASNGNYTLGATQTTIAPFMQYIEGTTVANLNTADSLYISLWVKSNISGTFPFALQKWNSASSAIESSYVFTDTLVANTWKQVTKQITLPGSAIHKSTFTSFRLSLGAIGGSSSFYTTNSINQWVNGDYSTTSSATNWAATSGNYVQFTGVKLSKYAHTEFSRAGSTLINELMLCQRYYEKSYLLSDPPGTVSWTSCYGTSGRIVRPTFSFKVTKRSTPQMVLYNPSNGNAGYVYNSGSNTATTVAEPGVSGFRINGPVAAGTDNDVGFHWTADTEF